MNIIFEKLIALVFPQRGVAKHLCGLCNTAEDAAAFSSARKVFTD